MKITIFHGGCHGCTQQEINGIDFCVRCQYFDANWNLPDLNNREPSQFNLERARLKEKYKMGLPRMKNKGIKMNKSRETILKELFEIIPKNTYLLFESINPRTNEIEYRISSKKDLSILIDIKKNNLNRKYFLAYRLSELIEYNNVSFYFNIDENNIVKIPNKE